MIKKVLGVFMLLAFIFPQTALIKASELPEHHFSGLKIGHEAPDFQLKTLDGKTAKLSKFRGKKVILNFWTTWCPSCKDEIPAFNEFFNESGNGVTILAVNLDPTSDVAKFANEKRIVFPILLDEKEQVSKIYQVIAVPTTYFIDEKGIIRHKHLGAISIAELRDYTKKM